MIYNDASMEYPYPPRFLIAGQLRRDYLLPALGQPILDVPGGNALYSAAGLAVWEQGIGLISRVSSDYPEEWLQRLSSVGVDTSGIFRISDVIDQRFFVSFKQGNEIAFDNPVAHFAEVGYPFPRELLGYHFQIANLDSRTRLGPLSIHPLDIPSDYLNAAATHICPIDYLSHNLLPSLLQQGHITTITLDPSPGYMNPAFWKEVLSIIANITAFMPSEQALINLFQGRSTDLWEMAEAIASYGCEIVVIKRGSHGQYLYDSASHKRWVIPAYPGKPTNPNGSSDAFSGGFLAGWRRTYDPLQAALYGNISASLVSESCDVFYAYNCMPGLPDARLNFLQELIQPG